MSTRRDFLKQTTLAIASTAVEGVSKAAKVIDIDSILADKTHPVNLYFGASLQTLLHRISMPVHVSEAYVEDFSRQRRAFKN